MWSVMRSHFPAEALRLGVVGDDVGAGALGPRRGVGDRGDAVDAERGRLERVLGGLDDRLGGEAELAEERLAVRAGPEVLEADAAAGVADDVAPALGDPGLDADPGLDRGGRTLSR